MKIFLECIPFNKNQWIEAINKNRNIFKRIKYELTVNPRDETNLNVDHPLAQETKVSSKLNRINIIAF